MICFHAFWGNSFLIRMPDEWVLGASSDWAVERLEILAVLATTLCLKKVYA